MARDVCSTDAAVRAMESAIIFGNDRGIDGQVPLRNAFRRLGFLL
jgi:hypothetical protein